MKELNLAIEQLMIQLHGIWIRRRYIIITAWLLCPIGWYHVYKMPPVYQAEARVYFDTQTILEPLLRGLTVSTNQQQQVQALARTVLTRPNLEKVARQADLDRNAPTAQEFERLIDGLERNIALRFNARGRHSDNIYTLHYTNSDPRVALRVVQEMLNVFIESRLGTSRADQIQAERFLNEQIADYERRLIAAERRRSEFRRNQMNVLSGGEASYYARISNQESLLAATMLEIQELEVRLAGARRELENLTSMGNEGRLPATQFDSRIAEQQDRLDQLLMRFTENHPDVIETSRLLERLKQQREDELALLRQLGSGGANNPALMQSTLFERMVTMVSELEGEIASRKLRASAIEQQITNLRSSLHLIPEIEAEYAALNRDYEINKSNYEALLSRREAADMARRIDATESDLQFRVIDPPRVPMLPAGPNRLLYYTAVLFLGVGAGVGMALLRNLLSPVLTNRLQLRSISNYPVFGVVSHTNKNAIVRQVRLHFLYFVLLSGLLFSAYLALVGNEILVGKPAAMLSRVLQ